MTSHQPPAILDARRQLDLLLTAAITDIAWRWHIVDRYLSWLTEQGWHPPHSAPDPSAAGEPTSPTPEYEAAKAALRGEPRGD